MITAAPERTLDDVITDLDLDERLRDAVPPPTCESEPDGVLCGEPAVALAILHPCACSLYLCASHASEIARAISISRFGNEIPRGFLYCWGHASLHREPIMVDRVELVSL